MEIRELMACHYCASPFSIAIRVSSSRSIPNCYLLTGNGYAKLSRILLYSRPYRSSFAAVFSRRKKNTIAAPKTKLLKSKKTCERDDSEVVGDETDKDPFEALFSQLELDLKNNVSLSSDEDDDITEDDFARFEQELAEEACDEEFDEHLEALPHKSDNFKSSDDEEELLPKLKNWQLRRLAHALKMGRRKTGIKNLSAELGMERIRVLEILRNPPLNLLTMSVSLPDEVAKNPEPVCEPVASSIDSDADSISESQPKKTKDRVPIHDMQANWSLRKRLKKAQIATLEKVYSRTKRPSNTMISSIVHVTNIPWKRVVKWFEDKRVEVGIPVCPEPYRKARPQDVPNP